MDKDPWNVQNLISMDNMWTVWKKGKEKFNLKMGTGFKALGNLMIKFLEREKPLMVSIKAAY